MGEEIAFENGRISWDRDLDLGSCHTASLVDLYLHTRFHGNRRNVLWTNGRTFETH